MVRLAAVARSTRARRGVRSLLGGAPPAAEVVAQLGRLGPRLFGVAAIDDEAAAEDEDPELRAFGYALAPHAEPVRVAVRASGDVVITARTSTLGPGYHVAVAHRLARLAEELELAWLEPSPLLLPTARGAIEAAHVGWLAARLRAGLGRTRTRIALGDAPHFHLEAPIHTPLGPRDEAWRTAVLADARAGRDAFPWWGEGPVAQASGRALRAMWCEVPWREPLDDDERALLARVDADLRVVLAAGWTGDGVIEPPWAAWAELQGWLGLDDAVVEEVARRAGDDEAAIGYRRWPMTMALSGGWTARLPGDVMTGLADDGAGLWATNGVVAIEFVSVTAVGQRDAAALLATAPERHPVCARHDGGGRYGRVERQIDGEVHLWHAMMAAPEAVALLTLKGAAADEAWALDVWRSLRWGPAE
jgi:hypothetical protein